MSNYCSQLATIETTVVNTMNKCNNPIYNVTSTIAKHSEILFRAVKNLQNVVTESGNNGFIIEETANVNYDTCLCDNTK